jgi:hypothetical protein
MWIFFIFFVGANEVKKEDVKFQLKESDFDFVSPRVQDSKVKCKTEFEGSVLLLALEKGDLDMMKDLVRDHGADVNEEVEWNGRQSTPLIVAMSVSNER